MRDRFSAHARLIGIAADLARGAHLPRLPDGMRCGPRRIEQALDLAQDRLGEAAIGIRHAADDLMNAWDSADALSTRLAELEK